MTIQFLMKQFDKFSLLTLLFQIGYKKYADLLVIFSDQSLLLTDCFADANLDYPNARFIFFSKGNSSCNQIFFLTSNRSNE